METINFRWLTEEVDIRNSTELTYPLMSVSQTKGVIPRSELMGNEGRAESLDNYKVCLPGQIVINRMSASSGALGLAKQGGLVSPDYAVLAPTKLIVPRYLEYLMHSKWFIGEMVARLKGIGAGGESASVRTPRINISDLRDVSVQLPPIEEQRRIADYLDEQVSLISQTIELRLKELELRTEYERRIIDDLLESHPKIKMKHVCEDSGQYGLNITPEEYRSEGIRLLRTSDFGSRDVEPIYISGPLENRFLVKEGDILLTRSGTVGQSFLVGAEEAGSSFAGFLIRFRCKKEYSSQFLAIVCKSTSFQDQVAIDATVSTIPNFNADKYANIEIPALDLEDQLKLIDLIAKTTEMHVKLMEPLNRAIKLLDELKVSLITNSVTGGFKIQRKGK